MLTIRNVSIAFGGIQVLKSLNVTVEEGQIHSIIGPNGAGKTTLFNIITGLYKPNEGNVHYQSHLLNALRPYQIAQLGISRSFQNIRLFPNMSVAENLRLGHSTRISSGISSLLPFIGAKKQRELDSELDAVLTMLGLQSKAEWNASQLAYGEQKRLEIGRAEKQHRAAARMK